MPRAAVQQDILNSNSLKITVKLDTGLYDDGLALLSPNFFNLGVTNESFRHTVTLPVAIELLNTCVRNGVSRSAKILRTATVIGSTAEDLSGNRWPLQRLQLTTTES